MKNPVLVVMAAGMGSRYGGLKQIDPVGSCGEAILDYSIYDAYEAGFSPFCPILLYPMFLREDVAQEHNDMKDMARDILKRSTVLVVCGGTADEDVMDDIATAKRFRVATTTLDGILLAKGKGRHD